MPFERAQIDSNPHVIDFGIGQPQLELLPRELIWNAGRQVLSLNDNRSLNYGHPKGDGDFREALTQFLAPVYEKRLDPASLLTTSGASLALHLIAHTFAQPGDTVLVEEPTYFLAKQIFVDAGLKIVGVPLSLDGLDLSALKKAVKKHKPAFFYTIPTYQNPTGFTLTRQAREALVELAESSGFLLLADEVYQLLSYGAPPPRPLAAFLDSEHVLSVGSFSKILAPGLRLGWIQTSEKLQAKLLKLGLFKSGGGLNPFITCLVGSALRDGSLLRYVQTLRRTFAHRVEVMDRCLQTKLGESVAYQKPTGGYFFWLKLSEKLDAAHYVQRAQDMGTGFRPGHLFSCEEKLNNYLRLSFAHYSENAIEVGIDRLARTLKEKSGR